MLHFSSSLSLSLSFAPLRYPLAIASPFVFNISPGRWGALARDIPSTATFSALQHSFFVVFFSLFFLLSLQFHLSLSLPRFILLFLSFISYFYFLGHIRIIYIISLTPLAFGLFRPEQVTNRTVCLCVLRARLCVWVCVSVSIKVDVYAHTIILEVLIKTNH